MDFSRASLPDGALPLACLILAGALCYDWRRIDWRALAFGPGLNRLGATSVCLMVFWHMSARLGPGFGLHILGVTAAVLMLGRGQALLALAIASLGAAIAKGSDLAAWPFDFTLLALMPAWFADAANRWIQRRLPHHFFIFVFVNTCLVAALGVLLVGLGATATLGLAGHSWQALFEDYLPYFLLLAFAESWMCGVAITLLVVYRPGWVAAFDDQSYLMDK
ncbi:energy-coupling factor ABC transporter permease [Niveibacterium sp. SC-1]|uniref:energy-coupling factor ABC transporter permease n=1 Tax=Niveibacterium sp. SC-1 TaxID=3135646 RepID=UPI00311FF51E